MASSDGKSGYLVTENLVKRFDEALAVDEVSLSIGKGEIFALRELRVWQIDIASDAGWL